MRTPKFSIIIPVFNEAKTIETCIRAIQESDYPASQYEIVVADNGSTDETADIARACGAVVLKCGRVKGISAMRNMGAAVTTGEVIVFIDADVRISNNLLRSAAVHFNDGFRGAIGFVDDVPEDAGWVGRVWGGVQRLKRSRVMKTDSLPGRNLFVNRPVYDRINGFDEELPAGEDKDFSMRVIRAGCQVISIPSPNPIHLGYDIDLRTFVRKEFWRQGSTLHLARRHGYSLRSLRNPLMSVWHLVWAGIFILVFLHSGPYRLIGSVFILWWLPATGIALKVVGNRKPLVFLLQFTVLTFIRWNIAGMALVRQLLQRGSIRCHSAGPAVQGKDRQSNNAGLKSGHKKVER